MKTYRPVVIIVLAVFLVAFTYAQDNCKVLVPELAGTYVGKCKKGLANGKGKAVGLDTYEGNFRKGLPNGEGVYTWANGSVYDGRWVFGQRDGEGVYKFNYAGNNSIQKGIWKDDKYIGKKPRKPQLIRMEFVTRYNFRREGDGDRILIDLKRNGQTNRDILDFSIISSSGSYFESGRSHGLETIVFPVLIKIKYTTWNQMGTMRQSCTFECEIFEPGNWQIDIVN